MDVNDKIRFLKAEVDQLTNKEVSARNRINDLKKLKEEKEKKVASILKLKEEEEQLLRELGV